MNIKTSEVFKINNKAYETCLILNILHKTASKVQKIQAVTSSLAQQQKHLGSTGMPRTD